MKKLCDLLLSQELKYFLARNGCSTLFMEHEIQKSLSKASLNFLGDKIVEFIEKKFSIDAPKKTVIKVCQHVILLFPQIKSDPSTIGGIVSRTVHIRLCIYAAKIIFLVNGQDLLYNCGQRKGIVYNKLFHKRYRKKDLDIAMNNMNLSCSENDNGEDVGLTNCEELEYQLFFRTCLLPRDKEILKIKMKQSILMREQMIKNTKMEFHLVFPFYFLDSDLVRFYYLFEN